MAAGMMPRRSVVGDPDVAALLLEQIDELRKRVAALEQLDVRLVRLEASRGCRDGAYGLERRVEQLERRAAATDPGARDGADIALLEHLARIGRTFTTADVFRHAAVDGELERRLVAADIDNPRQLGRHLRRAERAGGGGDVRVRRVGATRDGLVWTCEFAGFVQETREA